MVTFKKPSKGILIGAGVAVLIIAISIGVLVIRNNTTRVADANSPSFETVLPQGKDISELGGWNKLTPPNGEPFFVFTDTIDGIGINVSQQPLPEAFKANRDTKIAELAKGYNATETFDANGIKVYIGNSAKGPQSVIFTKNELLVLITSKAKIKNDAWVKYITSLQ